MIQPNELRIGSWYLSVKFRVPVRLEAEDIHQLVIDADGADIEHYIKHMFEAIPLTDELLLKAGKTSRGLEICNSNYPIADLYVDKRQDGKYFLSNCSDGYIIGREIKYLHELCNLYLDIKGEELPIKM